MTNVNASTFSPEQLTHSEDAVGIALVSLGVLVGMIFLVLAIVTPSGFCSLRRRWTRRMKRLFGTAGSTLLTEIRGEEFYLVPVSENLDDPEEAQQQQQQEPVQEQKSNTAAAAAAIDRERAMIAAYKNSRLL
jgi:hypothetical protein